MDWDCCKAGVGLWGVSEPRSWGGGRCLKGPHLPWHWCGEPGAVSVFSQLLPGITGTSKSHKLLVCQE